MDSLPADELVVKKGVLLANKNYKIPMDYDVDFDVDAENSLLIMLESMKREGLQVEIGRKATSYEEEKNYIVSENNDKYDRPNEFNSDLRTGSSVEIYSKNTDPRLESDFLETEAGKWLLDNSYKYGFVLRYPEGKEAVTGFIANGHIYKFVGTENAEKIHQASVTVDEYFK